MLPCRRLHDKKNRFLTVLDAKKKLPSSFKIALKIVGVTHRR